MPANEYYVWMMDSEWETRELAVCNRYDLLALAQAGNGMVSGIGFAVRTVCCE